MTERERLIDLCDTNNGWVNEVPAEEFADYLLSNGIIVPLVKVGGTVYIKNEPHEVLCMQIEKDISYYARFNCDEHCSECPFARKVSFLDSTLCVAEEYHEFTANDIGKTVFLTREEAEKALKERDRK